MDIQFFQLQETKNPTQTDLKIRLMEILNAEVELALGVMWSRDSNVINFSEILSFGSICLYISSFYGYNNDFDGLKFP